MGKDRLTRKLAVIFHADVVDSTGLVRLDETLAHQRIQDSFQRLAQTITSYEGKAHEIRGDALVAEFARASDAVSAALSFQDANTKLNQDLSDEIQPWLRIGIAMGEVIIADHTITGEGVVLAQRLEQLAEKGSVCVQGAARETIPGRLPFKFTELGEHLLKGFSNPVKVYQAELEEGAELPHAKITPGPQQAPASSGIKPSIAVLPFTNVGGASEHEYFSDGITEDITTALSRIRWLLVISRNSAFTYKGRVEDARKIADELGVRYVLEGSVRRSGSRVRVTAQLIDGTSGSSVWSDRYDRELVDIFAVQDELTATIVGALEPEVGKAERERTRSKRPENLDAWDLYQQGLSHLYRVSRQELAQAKQQFEQAIEQDPGLGPAYSGIAESYYFTLVYGYSDSPQDDRDAGLAAAKKAVDLDDEDAAAHCTLGRIYYARREHDHAIEELELALSLNPSLAWAHYGIGASMVFSGRAVEAPPYLATALKLSPRDPNRGSFLVRNADAHLFMHEPEEAVKWAKKALTQPNFQWSRYAVLISALGHLGRLDEARKAISDIGQQRAGFTVDFVNKTHLITDPTDMEYYLEGLRKAGVPEN